MNHLWQYFKIEWKRSVWAMSQLLLSMVILCGILPLGAVGISSMMKERASLTKVQIAVAAPGDDAMMKLALRLVSSMESVKEICDFTFESTQDAAMAHLTDGDADAVIVLTEDVYNDINYGTNTPIAIYLREDSMVSIGIFRELIGSGVSYIDVTEAAIYAVTDTMNVMEAQITVGEMENALTQLYGLTIWERDDLFAEHYLKSGIVDYAEFYASAIVLILLLYAGLGFAHLYAASELTVAARLRVYGIGPVQRAAVKIALESLTLLMLELLLSVAICAVQSQVGLRTALRVQSVPWMLLAAITMALFMHLVYTIAGRGERGMILWLLLATMLVLIGGVIIPVAFLPDILQSLAKYSPAAFWRDMIAHAIFG